MSTNNDRKNVIWNIIGLSCYTFASLFLLIIVKRINGMDIAGVFTYAFSLSTLFYYISLYYNRVYQVSNYNNNKTFNQFLSYRTITSVIAIILIIIFSYINKFDIYKSIIIILLMLYRIIDCISDTFYGYQQENGRLYISGISYTIKSTIGVIAFIIIDFCTNNLIYSLIGIILINILFLIIYDLRKYLSSNKEIKFDFSNCKLIFKESFSIFIFSFLSVYLANVQKYILTYYVSNELQTVFGIIIMPATALSLVGTYLIMPSVTGLKNANNKKDKKKFLNITYKIVGLLIAAGILCVGGAYLLGIPVLNIIYNIELEQYKMSLIIIIIASVFNALVMILSSILTILNENNKQLIIYAISSVITTIVCVYMVKTIGINGAVYSYLISYCLTALLFILLFMYKVKIKFSGGKNEKR